MKIQKKRGGGSCSRQVTAAVIFFLVLLGILIIAATRNSYDEGHTFSLLDLEESAQDMLLGNPSREPWEHYDPNRKIVFVHVGKAAGLTVRRATSLKCLRSPKKYNTEAKMKTCIERYLPQSAILARQVQYYFHIHGYRPDEIEDATSFLVALRNPVDRIVSTYRYSHPENCNAENNRTSTRPKGCYNKKDIDTIGVGSSAFKIFAICFPSAAMEDFAQSIMSPWKIPTTQSLHLSKSQQTKCRSRARKMVEGYGPMTSAPHMFYNYFYYVNRTLFQYPDKEVFAVRTEQTWEDLKQLDLSLGGAGSFLHDGKSESHGSEGYRKSPLTPEAYQKLCCVLEQEIAIYQLILERALNLNAQAKEKCMDDVRTRCGITSTWVEWRQSCQAQLEQDHEEFITEGY